MVWHGIAWNGLAWFGMDGISYSEVLPRVYENGMSQQNERLRAKYVDEV